MSVMLQILPDPWYLNVLRQLGIHERNSGYDRFGKTSWRCLLLLDSEVFDCISQLSMISNLGQRYRDIA